MEVDFQTLKEECEAHFRDCEEDRLASGPMLQIGKIITAMREYKAAVVAAHAPLHFEVGAERDPKQRGVLRKHRLAAQEALRQQKEWLISLDYRDIHQGQPWRMNEAFWMDKIWRPLFRWSDSCFQLLYDGKDRLDFKVLEALDADELEIEWHLLAQMMEFLPQGKWPIADTETGFLCWDSREESMTNTELTILSRIFTARGKYTEIYDPHEKELEPQAFRKALSRIKQSLTRIHFEDIAASLEKRPESYELRLNHKKLMKLLRERHTPK